jgi:ubiquitin-protein ligase
MTTRRQIDMQPKIIEKQLAKMAPSRDFTIVPAVPGKLDVFYILLHPTGGHYARQKHVLEFKTIYGQGQLYYFPFQPPNVKFLTEIYHTNISLTGSICLDILKDANQWSAQYTIETVMNSIIALLDDPNTSSPFNVVPSKHWARCHAEYAAYVAANKKSGKPSLEMREKMFEDYDQTSDACAAKNKLDAWAAHFPALLGLEKLGLEHEEKE